MREVWKDIEGYEGFYKISNFGRVKSLKKWDGHKFIDCERMLNPHKTKSSKNYYRAIVKLHKNKEKKDHKVHQLVAKAFLPNPNNYKVINHIDGNPLNNNVENLEWCTQKQNVMHAIENELLIRTIDTIDREDLLEMLNKGFTYDEIAKTLGIKRGTVFKYIKKFRIKKIYI